MVHVYLQALEEVMPRQQYLAALMVLLSSQEEALVTRALRLFKSCLSGPQAAQGGEAAMQICDQVHPWLCFLCARA